MARIIVWCARQGTTAADGDGDKHCDHCQQKQQRRDVAAKSLARAHRFLHMLKLGIERVCCVRAIDENGHEYGTLPATRNLRPERHGSP